MCSLLLVAAVNMACVLPCDSAGGAEAHVFVAEHSLMHRVCHTRVYLLPPLCVHLQVRLSAATEQQSLQAAQHQTQALHNTTPTSPTTHTATAALCL